MEVIHALLREKMCHSRTVGAGIPDTMHVRVKLQPLVTL